MKKLITSAVIIGFSQCTLAGAPLPEDIVSKTISLLKNDKPVEAFEAALESNEYIKQKKSDLDAAKYQFAGFVKQIGAPTECEELVSRNLINRYRIDQYLCLSEMQPFVIQFDFYRPDSDWRVQAFSFHSDADDYIEESIKFEIGKKSLPEEN